MPFIFSFSLFPLLHALFLFSFRSYQNFFFDFILQFLYSSYHIISPVSLHIFSFIPVLLFFLGWGMLFVSLSLSLSLTLSLSHTHTTTEKHLPFSLFFFLLYFLSFFYFLWASLCRHLHFHWLSARSFFFLLYSDGFFTISYLSHSLSLFLSFFLSFSLSLSLFLLLFHPLTHLHAHIHTHTSFRLILRLPSLFILFYVLSFLSPVFTCTVCFVLILFYSCLSGITYKLSDPLFKRKLQVSVNYPTVFSLSSF